MPVAKVGGNLAAPDGGGATYDDLLLPAGIGTDAGSHGAPPIWGAPAPGSPTGWTAPPNLGPGDPYYLDPSIDPFSQFRGNPIFMSGEQQYGSNPFAQQIFDVFRRMPHLADMARGFLRPQIRPEVKADFQQRRQENFAGNQPAI